MSQAVSYNFGLHSQIIASKTAGMKVVSTPNLSYVDSGLSCDTFNIVHIQNGNGVSEAELSEPINYFRKNNTAYCIWICEENLTTNVRMLFEKYSIKEHGTEQGMVLDLTEYKTAYSELFKNVMVVHTAQHLADFAAVIAANWTPPDENVIKYYQQTANILLKTESQVILLVYYFEGKPVSTIEMFPSDHETVGLYALATLTEYRGKGIGSTLMKFSLNKAKELGYKTVILQASEDGIGIYQRLGFKVVTKYFEFA